MYAPVASDRGSLETQIAAQNRETGETLNPKSMCIPIVIARGEKTWTLGTMKASYRLSPPRFTGKS